MRGPEYIFKTDFSKQYIVKMTKKDEPYSPHPVVVNVFPDIVDKAVKCVPVQDPELYERYYFRDIYFEWLLYIGYIKQIDSKKIEFFSLN